MNRDSIATQTTNVHLLLINWGLLYLDPSHLLILSYNNESGRHYKTVNQLRLTLLSKKANREMRTHSFLALLLIYTLSWSCPVVDATQAIVAPQDNITRPDDRGTEVGKLRILIRDILRRYKIPPVIYEKVKPPVEFYLDPPRFSRKDKSRLA